MRLPGSICKSWHVMGWWEKSWHVMRWWKAAFVRLFELVDFESMAQSSTRVEALKVQTGAAVRDISKHKKRFFFFVRLSIWDPNYDRVKYLKIPELHIGEKREFCASFNTGNALVRTKTTSQIWTLHGLRLRDAPYIRSSFICWTFCQQRDEGFLDERLLCKEEVVPTFGIKSDM